MPDELKLALAVLGLTMMVVGIVAVVVDVWRAAKPGEREKFKIKWPGGVEIEVDLGPAVLLILVGFAVAVVPFILEEGGNGTEDPAAADQPSTTTESDAASDTSSVSTLPTSTQADSSAEPISLPVQCEISAFDSSGQVAEVEPTVRCGLLVGVGRSLTNGSMLLSAALDEGQTRDPVISRCSTSEVGELWMKYTESDSTQIVDNVREGWVHLLPDQVIDLEGSDPVEVLRQPGSERSVGVDKSSINDDIEALRVNVTQPGLQATCFRNSSFDGDSDRVDICWESCNVQQ